VTAVFQQLFDDRAFFGQSIAGVRTTPLTYLAVFTEILSADAENVPVDLGVERELLEERGLEVQYLGSHSLHLDRSYFTTRRSPT